MRLINTSTVLPEEFLERNIPKYAILSHTWEDEEVSFKDMESKTAPSKKGYHKIKMTCQLAREAGLDWAWVDTCCIDKSSSAELSEAINSMFRWYQRAEICYAYLSDLPASATIEEALPVCRWFKRSWTLQELVAPSEVIFFDQVWNVKGPKSHLGELLSSITGIELSILEQPRLLYSKPVAVRMSWAANRDATRVEDVAYSLLGIFDLNIPLLYGEEEKAFQRLQEEIIKSTNDLTIFAWTTPSTPMVEGTPHQRVFCSVLAKSPSAFSGLGRLVKRSKYARQDTSVSSIGIKTKSPILLRSSVSGRRYILPLDCYDLDTSHNFAIQLRKCGPDHFLRDDPSNTVTCDLAVVGSIPLGERYLLTHLSKVLGPTYERDKISEVELAQTRFYAAQIRTSPGIKAYDMWSGGRYDFEDNLFFTSEDDWMRDSAIMLVTVTVILPQGLVDAAVEFQCPLVFYALGWRYTEGLQCSLVEHEQFRSAIDDLYSEITARDYDSDQLSSRLFQLGIPKSPRAVFKVPGTSLSAVVSFRATRAIDLAICRNQFWRIDLFGEICHSKDVGHVESQEWYRGGGWSFIDEIRL